MCSSIVCTCDCPVFLLPRRVPDLVLNCRPIYYACFCCELYADGCFGLHIESILCMSKHQVGFTHTWVSYYYYFEQIIELIVRCHSYTIFIYTKIIIGLLCLTQSKRNRTFLLIPSFYIGKINASFRVYIPKSRIIYNDNL